jgi:hypothetical protein
VVQGWKVMDSDTLAQLDIPEHETVIEIPKALLGLTSADGRAE